MDKLDHTILRELARDGRLTNVELADAVGLSPSPCLSRVKRLENSGYITGYGAHIALAKLGSTLTVFTEVTLKDHRSGDFSRFEQRARNVPHAHHHQPAAAPAGEKAHAGHHDGGHNAHAGDCC